MSSSSKYLLLASLYFAQGLPFGFFRQFLPILMKDKGASLSQIGLASFLVLPWALKFLWAPLIDKYGSARIGRKKSWILLMQGLAAVLFFAMGLHGDTEGYKLLLVGFLLACFVAATQDIASDGLAINLLNSEERGFGNGLQVAGYRLGMLFGGGVILQFFDIIQWEATFFLITAAIVVTTLPVFGTKEPPVKPSEQASLSLILRLLKKRRFLVWLLLIGFYKFGDAMTTAMINPFLMDEGFNKGKIGGLVSIGQMLGMGGALLGGVLVRYLGRYRAIILFGTFQAVPILSYYFYSMGQLGEPFLYIIYGSEHFTGGLATAAVFTAMMDVCSPKSAATDYTLQASFIVMTTTVAASIGGVVSDMWGYGGNFILASLLSLAGAMLFLPLKYRGRSNEDGSILL